MATSSGFQPASNVSSALAAIAHLPPGAALSLPHFSWEDYEALQTELGESHDLRIFYDAGKVVVMSILSEHEEYADLLQAIIRELTRALGWKLETRGSATLKRQIRARGAEPDGSCYIQNAERVIGKRRLDLNTDPPPDLVIEIDLTNESTGKFPIYAALGIAEIWRYDSGEVFFYQLADGGYVETTYSAAFPFLPATTLTEFLDLSKEQGQDAALEACRVWALAHKPQA
jgi:Uma2 family endonuclease